MSRLYNVTFNAREPIALGRFWSAALGYRIEREEPGRVRLRSGTDGPDLLILRVDDPVTASAVHLDLAVADVDAEVRRLVELGASVVDVDGDGRPRARTANDIEWYVLTDPAGNEFCIGSEP